MTYNLHCGDSEVAVHTFSREYLLTIFWIFFSRLVVAKLKYVKILTILMVIFVRTKKNFTSNSGATYGIRTTAPEEIELGLGIGVGRSFPPGQLFWNPSNIGLKCV